jgi:pyridoxine 4-dehydrogenase
VIDNHSDTFAIGGDMDVHRLGFGAMRLCGEDIIGPPEDEAAAREVLQHAVDCGVDFVDTADSYGPGVSERLIRESGVADDVVVATKAGLLRTADGDWPRHGEPAYLRNQVLVSRDRLGVETIDLYQYHAPDEDVPLEDALAVFGELRDRGDVRHVGVSNVDVEQLDRAREVVEVATVQNEFNVGNRESAAVLDACEDADIGFIPWFPLGGGSLDAVGEPLDEIAARYDASRQQIALAWLLDRSPVTLPIPGTSSIDHLEANVAASAIDLTTEEVDRLTAAA